MSIDWKLKKTLNFILLNVITVGVESIFIWVFKKKDYPGFFFWSMGVLNITHDASRCQILPSWPVRVLHASVNVSCWATEGLESFALLTRLAWKKTSNLCKLHLGVNKPWKKNHRTSNSQSCWHRLKIPKPWLPLCIIGAFSHIPALYLTGHFKKVNQTFYFFQNATIPLYMA